MNNETNICPRCRIREKKPGRSYCQQCRTELQNESYHRNHPTAKYNKPRKTMTFEQLLAQCEANNIKELVKKVQK